MGQGTATRQGQGTAESAPSTGDKGQGTGDKRQGTADNGQEQPVDLSKEVMDLAWRSYFGRKDAESTRTETRHVG